MDDEGFVEAVKEGVLEATVEDMIAQFASPSGRKPKEAKIQLSRWYNAQTEASKWHIRQVVKESAHTALFGLFCVLDGVRLIHEVLRKGRLRLVLETEAGEIILSDNQEISDLHDLLNAIEDVS